MSEGPPATATPGRTRQVEVLALTALIWFLAKFLRYAFPPLFEPLAGRYGVSNAQLGAAFTGLLVVYAAMQFPSGLLADRLGAPRVIAAGALVAGAAALALVVESPFPVLVGAMLFVGAGTGAHKTVAVRLLSRTYPGRTGRAVGVLDTVGAFAGVAAPAAVVFFAGLPGVFGAGWRTLFLAAGLAVVALATVFAVRVPGGLPDADGAASPDPDVNPGLGAYVSLLGEPRFATFVAVTVLFSFAYNGVIAFLPLYLTSEAGLAAPTAGVIYSALFAASLVQLLTGEASDRVGRLPVLGVTTGLATAALVALLVVTPTGDAVLLGTAAVCLGVGAHGYRPVRGAYLTAFVSGSIVGGSLGVVRTLLMGAGAMAPAVVGYVSEAAGFRPAFWLLVGAFAGATALVGLLWLLDEWRPADERLPEGA